MVGSSHSHSELSQRSSSSVYVLGMWQVSGSHGYTPSRYEAVAEMSKYVNDGYTTFDLADIYGPAGNSINSFSISNDVIHST